MTTKGLGPEFSIKQKDGKVTVEKGQPKRMSVSERIRQKKSKRTKVKRRTI